MESSDDYKELEDRYKKLKEKYGKQLELVMEILGAMQDIKECLEGENEGKVSDMVR